MERKFNILKCLLEVMPLLKILIILCFLPLVGVAGGYGQEFGYNSLWVNEFKSIKRPYVWVNLAPNLWDSQVVSYNLWGKAVGGVLLDADVKLKQIASAVLDDLVGGELELDRGEKIFRVWIVPGQVKVSLGERGGVRLDFVNLRVKVEGLDGLDRVLKAEFTTRLEYLVNNSDEFLRLRMLYVSYLLAIWSKQISVDSWENIVKKDVAFTDKTSRFYRSKLLRKYLRSYLMDYGVVGGVCFWPCPLPISISTKKQNGKGKKAYNKADIPEGGLRGDNSAMLLKGGKADFLIAKARKDFKGAKFIQWNDVLTWLQKNLGIKVTAEVEMLLKGQTVSFEFLSWFLQQYEGQEDIREILSELSLDAKFIEFEDGGMTLSSLFYLWMAFPKSIGLKAGALPTLQLWNEVSDEEAVKELLSVQTEKEGLSWLGLDLLDYQIQGRTLVLRDNDNNLVYRIKFQREKEPVAEIINEAYKIKWFSDIAGQLGLRQNVPELVKDGEKILFKLRVDEELEDILSFLDVAPLRFGPQKKFVRAVIYRMKGPEGLSLYPEDLDSEEDFWKAIDLSAETFFRLARIGVYHSRLANLFHDRSEGRVYRWDIDAQVYMKGRSSVMQFGKGPGNVDNFYCSFSNSNLRSDGLADFAELSVALGDTASFVEHIGNFLFTAVNLYGLFLKKHRPEAFEKHNLIPESEKIALKLKTLFLKSWDYLYPQSPEYKKRLIALIDFNRMALQMLVFMGDFYKKLIWSDWQDFDEDDKRIVERLYGDATYMLPPDLKDAYAKGGGYRGWGYINEEAVVKLAMDISNIVGTIKAELVKKCLLDVVSIPDESRIDIYQIKPESADKFIELLAKNKEELGITTEQIGKVRSKIEKLFQNYGWAWRYSGVLGEEDLGPMNGPYPIYELVKAVYLFSGYSLLELNRERSKIKQIIAEQIEFRNKSALPEGLLGLLWPFTELTAKNSMEAQRIVSDLLKKNKDELIAWFSDSNNFDYAKQNCKEGFKFLSLHLEEEENLDEIVLLKALAVVVAFNGVGNNSSGIDLESLAQFLIERLRAKYGLKDAIDKLKEVARFEESLYDRFSKDENTDKGGIEFEGVLK